MTWDLHLRKPIKQSFRFWSHKALCRLGFTLLHSPSPTVETPLGWWGTSTEQTTPAGRVTNLVDTDVGGKTRDEETED